MQIFHGLKLALAPVIRMPSASLMVECYAVSKQSDLDAMMTRTAAPYDYSPLQ
jgi:hypothetical protein